MYHFANFLNKVIQDFYQSSPTEVNAGSGVNDGVILAVLAVLSLFLVLTCMAMNNEGLDGIVFMCVMEISVAGFILALLLGSDSIFTPLNDSIEFTIGDYYKARTLSSSEQESILSSLSALKGDTVSIEVVGDYIFNILPYDSNYLVLPTGIMDDASFPGYIATDNVKSIQISTFTFKPKKEIDKQVQDLTSKYHFCKGLQINYEDGSVVRYTNPIDDKAPVLVKYDHPVEFNDTYVDEELSTTLTQTEFSILLSKGQLSYMDADGKVQELHVDIDDIDFVQNTVSNQSYIRYFVDKFKKPQFYYNITDTKASVDVNTNVDVKMDEETGKPDVDVDVNVDVH